MSELHKSARGKVVDMNRLVSQNELTVAVSNVKINARGDELGPGGKIIRQQGGESTYVGVPVEGNYVNPMPVKATPIAVQPAPEVILESPNALVQPAPEKTLEKTLEKTSKGK